MRVLVIYQVSSFNARNTVNDHTNSFRNYSSHQFHYCNVFEKLPEVIFKHEYDAIIFHYTFLGSERFFEKDDLWLRKINGAEKLRGFKIAIPQDEYDFTKRLCDFFERAGIDRVYTSIPFEEDIDKVYRNHLASDIDFKKTFTGFVDGKTAERVKKLVLDLKDRKIDIGYRARKLPAYFGKHGQLKYELVEIFKRNLRETNLSYDIENTNDGNVYEQNLIIGNSWLDFIAECKAFIGCEGGSSLLDFDGSIQRSVKRFTENQPDAEFEDIEQACFPNMDYNVQCMMISPRHFECAMTKTLQVLVEGYYHGVFQPNVHYIELKKDFSNIKEVISKLDDTELCQRIVDRAHADIIESGRYSYQNFVHSLFESIPSNAKSSFNFDLHFYYTKKILVWYTWWGINKDPMLSQINLFKFQIYRRVIIPNPFLHRMLRRLKTTVIKLKMFF